MDNFPMHRCTLYEELGLTRREGSTLCNAMGWERRKVLSPEQINHLKTLSQELSQWKSRDLSFQSFVYYYLEGEGNNKKLDIQSANVKKMEVMHQS